MAQPSGEGFKLDQYLLHHVENTHEWHLPFGISVPLPYPLSLHLLMILIASSILILLFVVLYDKQSNRPRGRLSNALESFVLFIRNDIAIENLGEEDGRKMTPVFCTMFFMILTLNLLGLIPLFSTATANFNVTGGLMLATFFYLTVGAIRKNGFKGFCHAFVIPGVPKVLNPGMIVIEVLGLIIRSVVLMVRLFANLLGGHFVLLSLTGMSVVLGLITLPFVVPVVLFVYLLEIFVAFLQAYIFTFLSAIFIGQMYHPEH